MHHLPLIHKSEATKQRGCRFPSDGLSPQRVPNLHSLIAVWSCLKYPVLSLCSGDSFCREICKNLQFPAYQKTDPIESWAHPQKYLVFEGNTCYRFRPPRKHMQKINLYRMGCPRLSLVFFLGIQIPLNLRAPFCTCCWFAWFGTALNLAPLPPFPAQKRLSNSILGAHTLYCRFFLIFPGGSYSVVLVWDMGAGSPILYL